MDRSPSLFCFGSDPEARADDSTGSPSGTLDLRPSLAGGFTPIPFEDSDGLRPDAEFQARP